MNLRLDLLESSFPISLTIFEGFKIFQEVTMLDIITDVSEITWDEPESYENRAIISSHLEEDGKTLARGACLY